MKKIVALLFLFLLCWVIVSAWDVTQPVVQTHIALQQMERSDTAAVATRASRHLYQSGEVVAFSVFVMGMLIIFGWDIKNALTNAKNHVNKSEETFKNE